MMEVGRVPQAGQYIIKLRPYVLIRAASSRLGEYLMRKLFIGFATFALAVAMGASSSSFRLNLLQPSVINGQELQPGEYRVELKDNKAIVSKGKKSVAESEVKVETSDSKFNSTSVRYNNGDGKYKVQEIRVGGTNTRLVFNE